MISISRDTKTWSDSPQRTDFEKSRTQSVSATDREKIFGDQNLGEVLNKVADPNWVDPAKKLRASGNDQMDKDAFLKMLLTQMKNQDPTSPLQSHEMAAQLAQFTSLEKLTNISDGIESMRKEQKPGQNFEALNLIGKSISIDGSKVARTEENEVHDIKFTLLGQPNSTELKVRDADGNLIRKLTLNALKEGENVVSWNGMLEDGTKAPMGDYTVEVEAKSSNGAKLMAEMKQEGRITGVNFTASGPLLLLGDKKVALSDVKQIIDPALLPVRNENLNYVPAEAIAPQGAKQKTQMKPETKEEKVVNPSGMESVALSREMITQLKKDGIEAGL
jgi:flagellar basal-body rod modification protein FlgD